LRIKKATDGGCSEVVLKADMNEDLKKEMVRDWITKANCIT